MNEPAMRVTVEPTVRQAGFTSLYDAHVAEIYRFVHRRCRDQAMAEDVTQETFLSAVRTVDDPTDVTVAWLIRVAQNRLMDIMRREVRHASKIRLIGVADDEDDLAESVATRNRVCIALEHLDSVHRLVLMLHYVDGETIASLADELGRTPKAIEALVTRARRSFRHEMEDQNE